MFDRAVFCLGGLLIAATACAQIVPAPRVWSTGFERESDAAGFYVTPQAHLGTSFHGLQSEQKHSGEKAHAAWIKGANNTWLNADSNHRAYPTIQLHKLPGGGYRTPVLVEWWMWQDFPFESPKGNSSACEWISYATLSLDASDRWSRVVLLNQGWEGYTHLMHVQSHNDRTWSFQERGVAVPQRKWTRLTMWLDAAPEGGRARAWVDGRLVSEGKVGGGAGRLEQAHFGMYADPDCRSGRILNDDLAIYEAGSFVPPPEGAGMLPSQQELQQQRQPNTGPGSANAGTSELDRTPVEASTRQGDAVRLHPNGRWEYVDPAKAAKAREIAASYPENNTRPVDAQGGVFGVGRTIMPGDKDYNRGSLSGKGR